MARRVWAWATAGLMAAGIWAAVGTRPAAARQGVVKSTDGQTLDGEVNNDNPNSVTVVGKGGTTVLPREKVASIQWIGGIEEEYKARAAKLPKNYDAAGHIALARWCFENKAYDLARMELDTALRIEPNNTEATTLYQTVVSQQRLDRSKPVQEGPKPTTPGEHPPTTGTAEGPKGNDHTASERVYLKPADINIIRQAEWRFEDNTVRARVEPEVREKYVAYAGGSMAAFNKLSATEQAIQVLQKGLPEMRKGVTVTNDPLPLAEYKRTIQPIILSGCAAAGCHGGPKGGNLFLYPDGATNEAAYTNFFILSQYRKTDEYGQQRTMIDRTYPDQSLLLQYGLPADVAQARHPDVPKGAPWRGIFKGRDDAKYRTIAEWMSHSLRPVAPEYDIQFSLNAPARPATAPASTTRP